MKHCLSSRIFSLLEMLTPRSTGTVFNSVLKRQLNVHAGLTASESSLLLQGGTTRVREITNENFPLLFNPVLEAYNSAVTKAFVCIMPLIC
jgi:hypothetical protein